MYRTTLLCTLCLRLLLSSVLAQDTGEYPSVASVAAYRPVSADSVCGAGGSEQYCQFTSDAAASLLPNCIEATCNNTCPFSSPSPSPFRLAEVGVSGAGVTPAPGREGNGSTALRFESSFIDVPAERVPALTDYGFSFAAWINREEGTSRGTLISKSSSDPDAIERNYAISVDESSLTFDYLPDTLDTSSLPEGSQRYRTVLVDGLSLPASVWHHVAVTVYAEDATIYINGTVEGVAALEGKMVDTNRSVLLGQSSEGVGSYSGLMEDMYLYTQALTEREVMELVDGSLPFVHLSTECHCPPSHPVIDIDSEMRCIQHTGTNLVNRGSVERINPLAHPPGFINDFATGPDNGWISAPGDRQANVTLTLTHSLYELIFINFRFGSPRFKAAVLETSRDGGMTFEPIQYFADDCMTYFNLPDDGPITEADDVICITSQSFQTPTFGVDVRFRLLDQQVRPFDLNTSPVLRNFILSSHLRLRLVDLFTESTSTQHQYYNILEVTVAARCACNGHSSRCGNSIDSVCECTHNTTGDTCDRCLPLYNDKPWRYGETNNAYPCKMCDCNGHAESCHYNASVDPFPNSYDQGGGGVCDNCQSNTAGQHCESCALTFYRPSGVSPTDSSPCVPCDCDTRGVTDNGDCVKSEGIPGQVVGQCQCKANVMGLQCDTCRDGFFALSATNPQGCSLCNCNTDGTVDASVTCDAITGQCQCKENVVGLKCDQCTNGTTSLTSINELGCSPCACDLDGSLSSNCDAVSGACDCKPGVGGLLCDECLDGYFGFSETGCERCTCNESGVESNVCNKTTGECPCLANVEGQNCDVCASGYYNLTAGCVECGCNSSGTVGGSETCHSVSGQCQCKDNVEGRTCDACVSGFTNLNASDIFGCTECDCSDFGTNRTGSVCDPVTSQCHCLPSATGVRCDSCVDGFYSMAVGCVECGCDLDGSSSAVCDMEDGQCPCNDGVGGRECDVCLAGFFQFPSCMSCGCNGAGTVSDAQCDVDTGECNCKTFVTGDTCNMCQPGYQMLDTSNPFGCSAAPDEQGPPTATPLSSTTIRLTWLPPEAPNGVILGYQIYRNGSNIANTTDTSYNDTDLIPNTCYTYFIVSFNIIGSTNSAEVLAVTLEGIPTGLDPPVYPVVNSTAVEVSWSEPDISHGLVIQYRLILVVVGGETTEEEVFRGLALSYVVTNLQPFTVYSFVVQACTSGGCGPSDLSQVETAEALPTFQPAPTVTTLSATSLSVRWTAPDQPNGVIVRYEVFLRAAPFQGDGQQVATVNSSVFLVEVGALLPFTTYQFSVESHTVAGGTRSEWSEGTTAQSAPSDVPPPSITALSSTSLQVFWTEPDMPNGVITEYILYSVSSGSSSFLTNSSSPGAFVVNDLQPFTEYSFLVEACTIAGCTESAVGTGFTEESVPIGQPDPTLTNITASSVSLQWEGPSQPNGIITNYVVHRRTPSLLPSPAVHDVGVSFTGNGFTTFTPSLPSSFENELTLRFRTLGCCGILFYTINTAETDMLAVELRDGVPWFIFDAGTGPGAIRPDGGAQFNDGSWHTLRVVQSGSSSSITVDGMHSGSGVSVGSGSVVGYVVHYVGGIPSDSPRQTTNGHLNPNATLVGSNFAGCLFDVTFNDESFDFSSSAAMGVGSLAQGCPVELTPTAQFLGGGYLALEEDAINGSSFFNTSFRFRTTHADGLLFFMYASDDTALGIELRDSNLHLVLSGVSEVTASTGQQLCNGEWHSVHIEQEGDRLRYAVNEVSDVLTLPSSSTVFSSRLFFGGVPGDSVAFQLAQEAGLDTYAPFSGCVRMPNPLLYVDGVPAMGTVVTSELVNFDGCGDAPGPSCVDSWTDVSAGMNRSTNDQGLTPFTAHLYRVEAMNSVGSAYSSWVATNTLQSAPSGVGSVALSSSTSSSLTLTWDRPTAPNGLVIRYTIVATPTGPAQEVTVSVDITEPEQTLEVTLEGLLPFTTYSTTLSASSAAGTGSGVAVNLTTMESAPMGVQPAYVTTLGSRTLVLSWDPPTQPNGIITGYTLFVDGEIRFSGTETLATVDNLLPSTLYTFRVQACTSAGCANSSETSSTTLPDRPAGLAPPSVIALTPTSLKITWEEPIEPNGEILQYELQQLSGDNLSEITTLFTGRELEYQLTNLTPNTLYSFRVLATNAGGTTVSDVAQNRTLEDAPDGLSAPELTILNATAISAAWAEPTQPNGVITEYILFRNGTEVFSGLELSFVDSGLDPFTRYSYSVQACTSGNCSTSTQSSAQTEEATPEGIVTPTTTTTATSFSVVISDVVRPNGIVRYVLSVTGEFASSPDGVEETRVVFNDTEPGTADVSDLVPFSSYEVDLTVSNGAGAVASPTVAAMTEPAAPEGLAPPTLSLVDATTLQVSWSAPDQPNDETVNYLLTIFNDRDAPVILDPGFNTSAVVPDLRPFTAYTVEVLAYNSVGNISSLATVTTGETAPTGFDRVVVEQVAARFVLLSWDPPAQPNGILTNYTILRGGQEVDTVPPSSHTYNVTSLRPFTSYQFSVVVCTAAGCVQSEPVESTTLEDVPEGVRAPSVTPTNVENQLLVTWQPPDQPNGVILLYHIERALRGSEDFIRLGNVTNSQFLLFADLTTQPFTEYDYRIVAVNSAGSTAGPSTSVRSPEAAPEGVQAPTLSVLSSTAIEVSFQSPLSPNGIITSYTLTRHTSTSSPVTISLNTTVLPLTNGSYVYEDTPLAPFTNYTYTLTVCTSAGCTTGSGVWSVTDEATPTGLGAPTTNTIDHTSILVSWNGPTAPNGVVLGYDVLQHSLGFEVPPNATTLPNCCQEYLYLPGSGTDEPSDGCSLVEETGPDTMNYTVPGLQAFSNYQYCIIVTNRAGSAFSPTSPVTQTSAAPMPLSGPELTALTVNSTAIFLSWSLLNVSQLLGPLEGYTLYGREAGGAEPGEVLYSGEEQQFTAGGLLASTEYVFVVSVSNGRGSTFGNEASAVTEEGIPANLSAPQVLALSAVAVSITWTEPNEPNGVIISYTIFINSVEHHNQTLPGTLEVGSLSPFTLYTVRVEACTQFGCTRSPQVEVMTLESAPVGLASPTVIVTGPTSADISWTAPSQANGIITSYQLFQTEAGQPPRLIFANLSFHSSVVDLRPFTTYGFEVYAINGAGNVSSGVTMATTEEAPPTSIDPPTVTVASATEIQLRWEEPEELNGVLLGYQVYRNGSILQNNTFSTTYTDLNLEPFTCYSYIIEVCTNGGCTSSAPVSNMTLEALPEGVPELTILDLQARSLVVSWQEPDKPNGIITEYILYQVHQNSSTSVLLQGLAFSLPLTGLTPHTAYSFLVETCNSIGCSPSNTATVSTLQAPPEGLRAPMLRNLTSTSAHIEWTAPTSPNGLITNYTLHRVEDGVEPIIVFQGLAFSFDDTSLIANTLYAYTVEATNAGGSTESAPSYIRTIADLAHGIAPPVVEVQGPTSIQVTWTAPEFPNGEVSLYILYMDGVAVFSGLGFEYSRTDLSPFTEYTFYYEVVNQAGSAGSTEVTARTDPAPPEGLLPPALTVLGATAIQVTWQPPSALNGELTQYRVRRRLFGNPPTEFLQYFSEDTSVFSFINSGLDPFTRYEYRVEVFNQAGSTLSEFSDATTEEDIPEGVPAPTIVGSNVFARNVTATWSSPSQPNGIITGYRLEYRLLLDPATNLPGETIIAAETTADVTTALATGLLPVTAYEFRVAAINSAGEGFSEWEVVTTAEDVPEGLTQIVVETRSAASLTLTWGTPASPNGVIREYIILLDGEVVYRDTPTTYLVTRLQPFTSYSLQLAACTSAGCTFGAIQFSTTAEAAPLGQAAPTVAILGPRSVELSWDPPSSENGIIILYEVLRQEGSLPASVIFSTGDTATRTYLDDSVLPATSYRYAIAANNSAGRVESEFNTITTPEAAPEGISAPRVRVTGSSSIEVSWDVPVQPNGFITRYQVFRDGGGLMNESVYIGQNRQFTDDNLAPFTTYTYTLQACTGGGCGLSLSISNTTFEDFPEGFDSVQAFPLSASSITAQWVEPSSPNGIILRYMASVAVTGGQNAISIVTTELSVNATNLEPFTNYTVTVDTCNSIGCATGSTTVVTLESLPQFIAPPTLVPLDPTSINARWELPARPNGVIINYILRRNGVNVFEGNALEFNDTNLLPNEVYTYTVQAFTSVGGGEESSPRSVQTPPDTPEDISPPNVTVLGAESIQAEWMVPGQPNGVIQRYILSVNGAVVFDEPSPFQFTVDGLIPFTVYEFRLDVCTTTCGNSSLVTVRTGEAPPTGQAPPTLIPFQNTTVLVAWQPPAVPNGIISEYQLERKTDTNFIPIYSGLNLQFQDSGMELRPATAYEYRVISLNSAGNSTSAPSPITLPDAAPEGFRPPQFSSTTSSSLMLTAHPPGTPNGQITRYILYQNGSIIINESAPANQSSSVEFVVTGLQPYTIYAYRVEVCTVGGCGTTEEVHVTTAEDIPRQYDSTPVGVALSARSILVSWSPPSQPNGVIRNYTLWFRLSCPQPDQPQLSSQPACLEGPFTWVTTTERLQHTFTGSTTTDPFPYSRYQFMVEAQNSVEAVNSTVSDSVETLTSAPEVKGDLQFETDQANGIITLDWSSTFRPNGPVRRYTLIRNGIPLSSRPVTSATLYNEPMGIELAYVVMIQTGTDLIAIGEASIEPINLQLDILTTPQLPTNATTEPPTEDTPFYQEAAFIIGMVILGISLLFILGAIFLCFVRPRGDPGYPVSPPSVHLDPTPTKQSYEMKQMSPAPFAGSWSPGQPIWEDLPDLREEEGPLVTPRKKKSYSPQREERAALLEEEEEEILPDTHITGYANGSIPRHGPYDSQGLGEMRGLPEKHFDPTAPPTGMRQPHQPTVGYASGPVSRQGPYHTASAEDDFGTFRASQTTFADTKV